MFLTLEDVWDIVQTLLYHGGRFYNLAMCTPVALDTFIPHLF